MRDIMCRLPPGWVRTRPGVGRGLLQSVTGGLRHVRERKSLRVESLLDKCSITAHIKRRRSMKTTRSLLGLALTLTVVSGASAQSINGQNPVIFDHTISWPLAFQFDGTGPTIDVGNRPGLNTST